jgi:hypothetical protein
MTMPELPQQATGEHPLPQARSPGLRIVGDLLGRLHGADLAYCHWKSNEHLGAAVDGLTDLDILVDRQRVSDLQRILAESGFKRFAAVPLRAYPAIEDYLGCDHDTGQLVHLHLHYQLTLGQRHLKGYRLPWESRVLATRRLDAKYGVYVTDPGIELVLLLVRTALKQRVRDRLRHRLMGKRPRKTPDFDREFAWLRKQVDETTVLETGHSLLGPEIVEPLRRLLAEPPAPNCMNAFAAGVRQALRRHRTYGRFEAPLRAWMREFQWLADAVNRRYLHRGTPLRRVSPRGGAVIVLLGSDGAGKTTLARTLMAWLGWKLDVLTIYFGSGDGPSAFYRLPMRQAHRLLHPLLGKGGPSRPSTGKGRASSPAQASAKIKASVRSAARVPWALALSYEKRGKLRRMIRARNRGVIVICDRFAQADIPGFNDGLLLDHWRDHSWPVCRALAAWEARPYTEAALDPPELVIKLTVTPAVAVQRRPEMSLEAVDRRVQAVRSLRFPSMTKVVELSADLPLDEVTLAAKRLVWDEI